jgi:undecaprenyl-diphosphatase
MDKRDLWFLWSAAFAAFIAFAFDSQISKFFIDSQMDILATIMAAVSILGSVYIIPFLATFILLITKKHKSILASWLSLIAGICISLVAKIIIARPRPFQFFGLTMAEKFASWDSSFPSLHAMAVFAFLPLLDKKTKIYWLAFAVLVAFSRLYLGYHYTSDVIAGAMIGYLCGLVSLKIFKLK